MLRIQDFEVWRPLMERVRPHPVKGRWFTGTLDPGGLLRTSGLNLLAPPTEAIKEALRADGVPIVDFDAQIEPNGAVTVRAVLGSEQVSGTFGDVELVEGALPEPYRRRPVQPAPDHPRGPVDLAELERLLRDVWPDEEGMTDAEIDAAGARLGVAVPPEARVLYRVTRGRDQIDDFESFTWHVPVPFDVWALEGPRRQVRRAAGHLWWKLALTAGSTAPDSAIQALSQPPEWFVLGTVDWFHIAIDMVPGPAGKVGQVIAWTDESRGDHPFGAWILADSFLDFVRQNRRDCEYGTTWTENLPEYGRVTAVNGRAVEDVVSPELEVLDVGKNKTKRVRIAPAVGLPRLRTLTASPGAIADPLQIGNLDRLEYLRIGVDEWRALLDAGAVPRSLLAGAVDTGFGVRADLHVVADLLGRIRSLWGLPPAERAITVRGQIDLPPGRPTTS